jgi:hypothetical protein
MENLRRDGRWFSLWVGLLAGLVVIMVPVVAGAKREAPPWGHPKAWHVPEQGDGEFRTVPGASPVVGEGTRLRFVVEVEEGIGEKPDRFARIVEEVLFDPRSWAGSEQFALQRVAEGPVDFRITLASPDTVDEFCEPLDTEGKYSCWNGNRAMINLWRWYSGHPIFPSLSEYRSHVINHEVGHALGYGHKNQCPEKGTPAPVMMQQTIDLDGCQSNAWVNEKVNQQSLKRAYARVMGETLYYEQIARPSSPKIGSSPEQVARGSGQSKRVSARELYQIVFRFLYYDYLDSHGISATDTEVRSLARTLEERTYWLSDGTALESFLPTYVRNWKFRQHLYSQYQGEVRQDVFGFVPVEAYRKFLKERRRAGAFDIYLPDLADRFWTINPRSAVFLSVPVRRERVGQVIQNPPWMTRTSRR